MPSPMIEMCKTARPTKTRGRAGPRHHELWAEPGHEARKSGPGRPALEIHKTLKNCKNNVLCSLLLASLGFTIFPMSLRPLLKLHYSVSTLYRWKRVNIFLPDPTRTKLYPTRPEFYPTRKKAFRPLLPENYPIVGVYPQAIQE